MVRPNLTQLPPDIQLRLAELGTDVYAVDDVAAARVGAFYDDPWFGTRWRYCKSNAEARTGQLAKFGNAIPATGIDYSALYQGQDAGDMFVKMTNQGTVAQTLDCLDGGTITINTVPPDADNALLQQRRIVGNSAGGVSDVITIYLDRPLIAAVTVASYAFAMPSPYSGVGYSAEPGSSAAGLAAATVTASGKYFWAQTRGLAWLAPQANVGKVAHQRQLVVRHDGSIDLHLYNDSNVTGQQHIGYIVDNNAAANGATVIMLQME